MDNVSEVVALLRQQAELENQIMTSGNPTIAAEWASAEGALTPEANVGPGQVATSEPQPVEAKKVGRE